MGITLGEDPASKPETYLNGEGGIRTLDTGVNPYDGLANRWFQPLTHLSHYTVGEDRKREEPSPLAISVGAYSL